jgi:hypothetical protein
LTGPRRVIGVTDLSEGGAAHMRHRVGNVIGQGKKDIMFLFVFIRVFLLIWSQTSSGIMATAYGTPFREISLHNRDVECPQTPQRSRFIEMVHIQSVAGNSFVAVSARLDTRTHLPEGNLQTEKRGPYKAVVAHILIRNQRSNFLDGGVSSHHPRLLIRHYPVPHCGL